MQFLHFCLASLRPIVETNVSSALVNTSNSRFCPFYICEALADFLYQAFVMNVSTSGFYEIASCSNMYTFGYLYENFFNPPDVTSNLITFDDQSGDQNQFLMSAVLRTGISYIIVITTNEPNIVGPFILTVRGYGNCVLIPLLP